MSQYLIHAKETLKPLNFRQVYCTLYWEGRYGMEWTNKFIILGIDYNTNDMGEITTTNIEKKIIDIKKLMKLWQARKLSPYGKVIVIKSLSYPKSPTCSCPFLVPKKLFLKKLTKFSKNSFGITNRQNSGRK